MVKEYYDRLTLRDRITRRGFSQREDAPRTQTSERRRYINQDI
jgi:hypothetical protein